MLVLALFSLFAVAVTAVREAGFTLHKVEPDYVGSDQGVSDILSQHLPTHKAKVDKWGAGWIPDSCKLEAEYHGHSPHDFTVFNVRYDDCPNAWVMCRHKKSKLSQARMIEQFGKIPVRARSHVTHFMSAPPTNKNDVTRSSAAYARDRTILFHGDYKFFTYIHELGHVLDKYAFTQYGSPFSESKLWKDNYYQDTAISNGADRFQQSFAETVIVALFDKVVPGGIGTIQPNWWSFFHQIATIQGYSGDTLIPGGTCPFRIADSKIVPMGNSARRGTVGPRPSAPVNGSVPILPATTDGVLHH